MQGGGGMLGIEPRGLCMLGKCSTTKEHPQAQRVISFTLLVCKFLEGKVCGLIYLLTRAVQHLETFWRV